MKRFRTWIILAAVVVLASICGSYACDSSPTGYPPRVDATTTEGGSTNDGPGLADGAALSAGDRRLCTEATATVAGVSCADQADRFEVCATAFASGACLPETRAAFQCGIDAGPSAFVCIKGETALKQGVCEPENNALLSCIFGLSPADAGGATDARLESGRARTAPPSAPRKR